MGTAVPPPRARRGRRHVRRARREAALPTRGATSSATQNELRAVLRRNAGQRTVLAACRVASASRTHSASANVAPVGTATALARAPN